MKIYYLFFILYFSISLPFSVSSKDKSHNNPQINKTKKQVSFQIQKNEDYKLEDDSFDYESDFFRRKIFQKTLPPLSNKEKIIWSFRMANKNPFL